MTGYMHVMSFLLMLLFLLADSMLDHLEARILAFSACNKPSNS